MFFHVKLMHFSLILVENPCVIQFCIPFLNSCFNDSIVFSIRRDHVIIHSVVNILNEISVTESLIEYS